MMKENRDEQHFADQLVSLVQQIQPDPAFLDRLESQLNQEKRPMRTKMIRFVQLAAILAVVLMIFALSPTLRGLAQDAWRFFVPGESDKQSIVSHAGPEMESDIVLETGSSAPFAVRYPTYVPGGYMLSEEVYEAGGSMVTQVYECSAEGWGFAIKQRSVSDMDQIAEPNLGQFEVGASATIEPITVHDNPGEYVRGQWGPVPPSGNEMPVEVVWNSALDVHHIAWVEGGFLFEIFTSRWSLTEANDGACAMTKEDFIAVAESLK